MSDDQKRGEAQGLRGSDPLSDALAAILAGYLDQLSDMSLQMRQHLIESTRDHMRSQYEAGYEAGLPRCPERPEEAAMTWDRSGDWFIRSDDGRPHLVGWGLTAIKTEPMGRDGNGWTGLAICPRCHALTFQDDDPVWPGNMTAHERWHAATDYPIPMIYADRTGTSAHPVAAASDLDSREG
jgi:hypothetical protein